MSFAKRLYTAYQRWLASGDGVNTMPLACALFLAGVFFVLSIVHIGWALRRSAPGAAFIPTVDGRPLFNPGRLATLAVALMLAIAGVLCLWRVGLPGWGWPIIPKAGVWVIAVVFLARAIGDFKLIGFFKRVRHTAFARYDSWLYSPLCLLIAAVSVLLALLGPVAPR